MMSKVLMTGEYFLEKIEIIILLKFFPTLSGENTYTNSEDISSLRESSLKKKKNESKTTLSSI